MAEDLSKTDLALGELRRSLDNQLKSLSSLQSKVGTVLGFALTAIGLLFTLGRVALSARPVESDLAAGLMLISTAILGASYISVVVRDAPKTKWLQDNVNDKDVSPEKLKALVAGAYISAFNDNEKGERLRFYAVDAAIAILILGVAIFVVGVLLPT
jgi:hypothetical protein